MNVLISYDVKQSGVAFKNSLLTLGFSKTFNVNSIKYPLPESTVLKIGVKDVKAAIDTFREAVCIIKATDKSFEVSDFVAVEYVDIRSYK